MKFMFKGPSMVLRAKLTTAALIVVMVLVIIAAAMDSGPRPEPTFEVGDVVSFIADDSLRGVVSEVQCIRGASACKYSVIFAPLSKYRALDRQTVPEHIIKLTP